jgi:hypothetical protein
MQENSEIVHFDSAIHLMSSQNFNIENLVSREQISLKNNQTVQKMSEKSLKRNSDTKSEKQKQNSKELFKENKNNKNFTKNLLILKKSMEYITKFQDSDEEEDAVPQSSSNQLNIEINKLKSKQKTSKNKFLTSNDERKKTKNNVIKKELEDWIESKCELSSSKKGKNTMISVYQKQKEVVITKQNFYNPSFTKSSYQKNTNKYKSFDRIHTLDDQLVESNKLKKLKSNEEEQNSKQKRNKIKSFKEKSSNKFKRRYSVFDRLSSKKYRKAAIEENQKQKEIEEMKECTFKPSINKISSMICSFNELNTSNQRRGNQFTSHHLKFRKFVNEI